MTQVRSIIRAMSRDVPFSTLQLRALIYGLAGLQIVQGFLHPANDFVKSYWLISYREGFVRRGLSGQLLGLMVGEPTRTSTVVAGYIVAVASIVPVLLLIELLLRQRTSDTACVALMLAASPFILDQLASHRRPDQLGFAVLTLTAIALGRRSSRAVFVLGVAGFGFAMVCLIHEGTALYYVPFALAMVVAARFRSDGYLSTMRSVLLVGIPSAIVCIVLLARPAPAGTAERLRAHSAFPVFGDTMFDYLDDGASNSLLGIRQYSATSIIMMVIIGVGLIVLHMLVLRRRHIDELFVFLRRETPKLLSGTAIGAIAIGYTLTFALGVDWTRWFCIFGACWLICTAALNLQPVSQRPQQRTTLPIWLVVLFVYLALLVPLSESLGTRQAAFYPFHLLG